jgi:Spy/CpxP family protein refolding chaperone
MMGLLTGVFEENIECSIRNSNGGAIAMKISTNCLKTAVAMVVAATATAALAQGPGGGRGGFGGGGRFNDPTFLLGAEQVQKELELSDEQKTSVQKLVDDNRQAMMDLRNSGASFQDVGDKMQERAKDNKKKVDDLLLPPQRERLEQIGLQIAGANALSRSDVAEKLGLSDDQKSKLKELADDAQEKRMALFSSGPPADQQEMQDRIQKAQKISGDQKDKAMAVLTAEQKDKLEKMQGKKFELDLSQMMPRGGFGGGGQGGK